MYRKTHDGAAMAGFVDSPAHGTVLPPDTGLSARGRVPNLSFLPRNGMPAMLTPRQAQFAFVPLVVTLMSGVMSFAMIALHRGFGPGLVEAWLRGWPVAFAVALPAAWVILPGVRALLARVTKVCSEATGSSRRLGRMG